MTKILDKKKSEILWKKVMSTAENLPTLPDIVNQVLEQIDNPNSNPHVFQEIISQDPVLTAKVLKMSNSAYYGYSREIVTISEAIIILGMDTLKSLAIAASAYATLSKEAQGYGLARGDLWRHSLASATGARLIAKQLEYKEVEKFFVTGLLHDIGKILLSSQLGKYIDQIRTITKMRNISFDLAEREVMGFNHCDVGAELSNYWKLPELFSNVARYHHQPLEYQSSRSEERTLIEIVHIADILSYNLKIGMGKDGAFYKPCQEIFDKYHMDKKAIDRIITKIHSSIKEFEKAIL
ncbi:MAG: HDOD domain-containing protein [Spirochaetes bacterium]|nr:HDOD domain-containing protein [Spirochaetota bacterium]